MRRISSSLSGRAAARPSCRGARRERAVARSRVTHILLNEAGDTTDGSTKSDAQTAGARLRFRHEADPSLRALRKVDAPPTKILNDKKVVSV